MQGAEQQNDDYIIPFQGRKIKTKMQSITTKLSFNHFAAIPWLVLDMGLDPDEVALYAHYVRVAGYGSGACWESVDTTASKTKMTARRVRAARDNLANQNLILVKQGKRADGGDSTWYIQINDQIWYENTAEYTSPPVKNDRRSEIEFRSEIESYFF